MSSSGVSHARRERRQHPRFRASKDVFAILKNHDETVGHLFDIGRGGMSFRYIENDATHKGVASIDVFSPRDNFLLKRVPVRTVSDFAVGGNIPFSSIPVRQRCLQFLQTDPHQDRLISYVLNHHTRSGRS